MDHFLRILKIIVIILQALRFTCADLRAIFYLRLSVTDPHELIFNSDFHQYVKRVLQWQKIYLSLKVKFSLREKADEVLALEDNIIDVNGLEYFFGEVKAVDNLSLIHI